MSFDDALKACNLNDDCDCIRDDGCDGEDYSLDKNTKEILSVIPDDDLCIRVISMFSFRHFFNPIIHINDEYKYSYFFLKVILGFFILKWKKSKNITVSE